MPAMARQEIYEQTNQHSYMFPATPLHQQQQPLYAGRYPHMLATKPRHVQTHPGSLNTPLLTTMPEHTYMMGTMGCPIFRESHDHHTSLDLTLRSETYDNMAPTNFGFLNSLNDIFPTPMLTPGNELTAWPLQGIPTKLVVEDQEEGNMKGDQYPFHIKHLPANSNHTRSFSSKNNNICMEETISSSSISISSSTTTSSEIDQREQDDRPSPPAQNDVALAKREHRANQCSNCDTQCTPLWRRNSKGEPLCNACGLFFKLHGTVRPRCLKTDVIKKRNRTSTQKKRRRSSKRTSTK
ncbi:hypothetical protein EC973_006124 [Apophysomyces ossiformis]|uniref:GATA-type domain-containing protein n=1 Tax=Apophysomyces ossiformis TaxID=679940 RepID=A0A8H7BVV3_9FUNG|nr:hypothetical protein EC973_006124 [Apophysomyces ossiformis]